MHTSCIAVLALAALGATATARAEAVTYGIDPAHTFATFEIGHLGISTVRGRFDRKEGSVTLDRAAQSGKVELTIDVTSVSTGVEPFNKNLQGKDFFNTAEFPTARFVGDKFVFDGEKLTEVSGALTLLGKTNPVTLKALRFNCYMSPMLKREVCGGDFEGTLQRSQYGMNHLIQMGSPDAVKLVVQVEAIKQ
jgi:polyisoprenoid-binding protein YceI